MSAEYYVHLRRPYDGFEDAASMEFALECPEPSLTQQSQFEESDINYIVGRFLRTGELPLARGPGDYGDFTGVSDFQSALNAVIAAEDAFMELPATVRARFHNDPAELLAFVADDGNRDEAERLGLLRASEPSAPHHAGDSSEAPATAVASKSSSKGKKTASAEGDSGEA